MFLTLGLAMLLTATALTLAANAQPPSSRMISPKVMIVSMFEPEAQVWHDNFPQSGLGNLTSQAIAPPGLSMLFPWVFCTETGSVCQVTVGEGEINSAVSMTALVLSSSFNLTQTYFLLAGIAGVNPRYATIGSAAFARYAVQVALQYEIDSRSLPDDWLTGYIPYGRAQPFEYPCITYGTEVFELNVDLRDAAHAFAQRAQLLDEREPQRYRLLYSDMGSSYSTAVMPPSVVKCDSATSDVYYSGGRLAQAFENTTALWTNGTGVYCMSAQEDNATLEVLVRAAIQGLVDFSRVIAMRTGSNFDRPPPSRSDWEHLTHTDQNGFHIAIANLYAAGIEVVRGILDGWDCTYARGIAPSNYIGDIFGSLGGQPDFGFGSITGGRRLRPAAASAASSGGGRVSNWTWSGESLAGVEMARRRRFGVKGAMKM
ncbi:Purine nucleoside permease [Trichoderma ghanense]|uniref:Purine nucleoside permease n=1 Tax=Trichoderma ghanense TaxID=65468 RepID=A0ABY2H533_9HYPO